MKTFVVTAGAALALIASPVRADEPCGGLEVGEGAFVFKERLTLDLVKTPAGDACLSAVAAELMKRPDMQSVTIAARVPNDKVMRDRGLELANHASEKLVSLGVPRGLLSVVVPTGRPDEKDAIYVAFVQRRSSRPVAQVQAISGKVTVGAQLGSLRDTQPGAMLVPTDYLETGRGSIALVKLLDGTRVFLFENAILRVGTIELTPQGARKARMQVLRGEAMVWAAPVEGPLDFITGNATAGVRGTDFRVVTPEMQLTRVTSHEGTVILKAKGGDVFLPAGKGSRVDYKGKPEELRPLLVAPEPLSPLFGFSGVGGFLSWKPVPNAQSYRVEIADNAQFTQGWWGFEVTSDRWLVSEVLKPGKHFWRVTAIDPEGFIGYPSKIYAFTIR